VTEVPDHQYHGRGFLSLSSIIWGVRGGSPIMTKKIGGTLAALGLLSSGCGGTLGLGQVFTCIVEELDS
jgi:hypothetical protein